MLEKIILGENFEKLNPIADKITVILIENELNYLEAMTVLEIVQNMVQKCKLIND
jgi:hypothetical protein